MEGQDVRLTSPPQGPANRLGPAKRRPAEHLDIGRGKVMTATPDGRNHLRQPWQSRRPRRGRVDLPAGIAQPHRQLVANLAVGPVGRSEVPDHENRTRASRSDDRLVPGDRRRT